MSARDDILAALRAHRPRGDYPLPTPPAFPRPEHPPPVAWFTESLARMGGEVLPPATDPFEPGRRHAARFGAVCSLVGELPGGVRLADLISMDKVAAVDLAIVRAAFGVAETGSVAFTEHELGINALAYLAQHLMVVLDPADILPDLHAAYRMPQFRRARYAVLHTGPSATADIEGVLVHGAQGVRSLTVLLAPGRS